jgi:putative peptidoglycan lipid II flippase
MSTIVVIGIVFAPFVIQIFAPGFDAEKSAFTALLARVMYPFILLVSLAALAMGMLNARNVFGVPAMASSFFNIGSILGGITVGWLIDPHFGKDALIGLAAGTLIGGAFQLAVQFPSLAKIGFHFKPDFAWNDPGVQKILGLMGPAVIAASSVQVNVWINTMYASNLGDGPIVWLQNAFRLMQLPLGVFGVAVATITLPLMSRHAAAGDLVSFGKVLGNGLRLALFLTIPCAVGLSMLAYPIMSVLFEGGKCTPTQVAQMAGALEYYALGLAAYSAMKVLVPAFYAIDRKHMPMFVSIGAIAINAVLSWFFAFQLGLGHRGLALSTGCVAVTNFLVFYVVMMRLTAGLETRALVSSCVRFAVAACALAGVCMISQRYWLSEWSHMHAATRVIALFATIGIAGGAYLGCAMLLKVEETTEVIAALRKKLARGATPAT